MSVIQNETFDRLTLNKDVNKIEGQFCPDLRATAIPKGEDRLPMWERLPLSVKIPMKRGPEHCVELYHNDEGEKVYRDMNLNFNVDISKAQPSLSYQSLHDPFLRPFFDSPGMKRHLRKVGLVNDSGEMACSLKEYNAYRDYIRHLCVRGAKYAKWDGESTMTSESGKSRCKSAPVSGYSEKYGRVRGRVRALDAGRQQRMLEIEEEYRRKGEWYDSMQREKDAWMRKMSEKRGCNRRLVHQRGVQTYEQRIAPYREKWRREEEDRSERIMSKVVEKTQKQQAKTVKEWGHKVIYQREQFDLDDRKRRELEQRRREKVADRIRKMQRVWQKQNLNLYGRMNDWRDKRNRSDRRFAILLRRKILGEYEGDELPPPAQRLQFVTEKMKKRFKSLWILEDVLRRLMVPDFTGDKMLRFLKCVIKMTGVIEKTDGIDEAVDELVKQALKNIAKMIELRGGGDEGTRTDTEGEDIDGQGLTLINSAANYLVDKIVQHLSAEPLESDDILPDDVDDDQLDREANDVAIRALNEIERMLNPSTSNLQPGDGERYLSAHDLLDKDGDMLIEESLTKLFNDVTRSSLTSMELNDITKYTLARIRSSVTALEARRDSYLHNFDIYHSDDSRNVRFRKSTECKIGTPELYMDQILKTEKTDEKFPKLSDSRITLLMDDFAYAQAKGEVTSISRRQSSEGIGMSEKSYSPHSEYSENRSTTIDVVSDRTDGNRTAVDSDSNFSSVSDSRIDSVVEGILRRIEQAVRSGQITNSQLTMYAVSIIDAKQKSQGESPGLETYVQQTLRLISEDLDMSNLSKPEIKKILSAISLVSGPRDSVITLVDRILTDIKDNPENAMNIAVELSQSYFSLATGKSQKDTDVMNRLTSTLLRIVLRALELGHLNAEQLSQLLKSTGSLTSDNRDTQLDKLTANIKSVIEAVEKGTINPSMINEVVDVIQGLPRVSIITGPTISSQEIEKVISQQQSVDLSSTILTSCIQARLTGKMSLGYLPEIEEYLKEISDNIRQEKISKDRLHMISDASAEALSDVMVRVSRMSIPHEVLANSHDDYARSILEMGIIELNKADDLRYVGATMGALLRCAHENPPQYEPMTQEDKLIYLNFLDAAIDNVRRYQIMFDEPQSRKGSEFINAITPLLRDSAERQPGAATPITLKQLESIANAIDNVDSQLDLPDNPDVLTILKCTLDDVIQALYDDNIDEVDYDTLEKIAKRTYAKVGITSAIPSRQASEEDNSMIDDAKQILNLISVSYSSIGDNSMEILLSTLDLDDIVAALAKVLDKIINDVVVGKIQVENVEALHKSICDWWFQEGVQRPISRSSSKTSVVSGIVKDMMTKIHGHIDNMAKMDPSETRTIPMSKVDEIAKMIMDTIVSLESCKESEIQAITDATFLNVMKDVMDEDMMASKDFADELLSAVLFKLSGYHVDESLGKYKEVVESVRESIQSGSATDEYAKGEYEDDDFKQTKESITEIVTECMIKSSKESNEERQVEFVENAVGAIEDLTVAKTASHNSITFTTSQNSSLATSAAILKSIMLRFINKFSENRLSLDTVNDMACICAAEITHFCYDSGLLRPQQAHSKCPLIPSSLYHFSHNRRCSYKSSERLVNTINTILSSDKQLAHRGSLLPLKEVENEIAATVHESLNLMKAVPSDGAHSMKIPRDIAESQPVPGSHPGIFVVDSLHGVMSDEHDFHIELPPVDPLTTPTQRIADIIRATLSKVVDDLDTDRLTDEVVNNMAAVIISAHATEVQSEERVQSWLEHGQQFATELRTIENIATDTISQLISKVNNGSLEKDNMEDIATAIRKDKRNDSLVSYKRDLKEYVTEGLGNVANDLKNKGIMELQCQNLVVTILQQPEKAAQAYNELKTMHELLKDVLDKINAILNDDKNDDINNDKNDNNPSCAIYNQVTPNKQHIEEKRVTDIKRLKNEQLSVIRTSSLQQNLTEQYRRQIKDNQHITATHPLKSEEKTRVDKLKMRRTYSSASTQSTSTSHSSRSSKTNRNISNANSQFKSTFPAFHESVHPPKQTTKPNKQPHPPPPRRDYLSLPSPTGLHRPRLETTSVTSKEKQLRNDTYLEKLEHKPKWNDNVSLVTPHRFVRPKEPELRKVSAYKERPDVLDIKQAEKLTARLVQYGTQKENLARKSLLNNASPYLRHIQQQMYRSESRHENPNKRKISPTRDERSTKMTANKHSKVLNGQERFDINPNNKQLENPRQKPSTKERPNKLNISTTSKPTINTASNNSLRKINYITLNKIAIQKENKKIITNKPNVSLTKLHDPVKPIFSNRNYLQGPNNPQTVYPKPLIRSNINEMSDYTSTMNVSPKSDDESSSYILDNGLLETVINKEGTQTEHCDHGTRVGDLQPEEMKESISGGVYDSERLPFGMTSSTNEPAKRSPTDGEAVERRIERIVSSTSVTRKGTYSKSDRDSNSSDGRSSDGTIPGAITSSFAEDNVTTRSLTEDDVTRDTNTDVDGEYSDSCNMDDERNFEKAETITEDYVISGRIRDVGGNSSDNSDLFEERNMGKRKSIIAPPEQIEVKYLHSAALTTDCSQIVVMTNVPNRVFCHVDVLEENHATRFDIPESTLTITCEDNKSKIYVEPLRSVCGSQITYMTLRNS